VELCTGTDAAMRFLQAPGLTGESFYRTRQSDLRAFLVVLGGISGALYAGVTRLAKIVGVPSLGPELGLSEYMVEIILGATVGALAGLAAGILTGGFWELWHRRRRLRSAKES
jgi:hypothetical protein